MGLPVTPNAQRDQRDAPGSSNQARASQILGFRGASSLANLGSECQTGNSQTLGLRTSSGVTNQWNSLPILSSIADADSDILQKRQKANQAPYDVSIMPGEHTPIPALLPNPVSSPLTQTEQYGRTVLQSRSSSEYKSRVTIAISGSLSSGKATLTYLLAAVFEAATIEDTGFAGAQTTYPLFNGRFEGNPNKKGPITKVFVIHQNSYIKPVAECPVAEWSELYPYSPAMEVLNPQTGAARAFADERGHRYYERYCEAAYNFNITVDTSLMSNSSSSRFEALKPVRILKKGTNLDCRGAIDWPNFGKAINDGMKGCKNDKGILETEEGREIIAGYLGQPDPNAHIPLVSSSKLEPLRQRIREWIRAEAAQNSLIGFPGRSVVDGRMREILILCGSLLFLQTSAKKGAGGENLMKACDVKLFLPTLETEAIKRCFSQVQYVDPPEGNRMPDQPWMFEGYLSEVAWKEYKSEHAWLFENGDATNRFIKTTVAAFYHGIHVRDFYTANLEEKGDKYEGKNWSDETLDWAVRTILLQLSVEEASARQLFLERKMVEATG